MKTKFQTVKSWKIQSYLTITTVNSRVLINGSPSQSKLHYEVQKRKKKKKTKIRNTNTNKNDSTLETTKKTAMKTELERTSIKNQQLIRSSKLFSGRPVWHLIYTRKVWGVPTSERACVFAYADVPISETDIVHISIYHKDHM